MEPLLAVWGGMYLGSGDVLSAANLAPWVNDTLNELEFLLGSPKSKFGSLRASLGYKGLNLIFLFLLLLRFLVGRAVNVY